MIRKKLAEVPVEKGNQVSYAILCGWLGFVIGWVTHPECACWFPV